MRHLIILFLLLCWSVSCGRNTEKKIDYFELEIHIKDSEPIYSDREALIGNITSMEIFNHLLIARWAQIDYFFALLDLRDGSLLSRWGRKGRGPNEYTAIGPDFYVADSCLCFLDTGKRELNRVRITDLLDTMQSPRIQKTPYPYTASFRPKHIVPAGELFIANGSFADGALGVIDKKGQIADETIPYPFDCNPVEGIYRGSTFQSRIKSNPRSGKFVHYYFSSDIFEIHEMKNSQPVRSCLSDFRHIPKLKVKPRGRAIYAIDYERSIAGLLRVATTDSAIYFTYSNDSYAVSAQRQHVTDEILCFDWEGRKQAKYLLPLPVKEICVSGNDLYGVRYDDDEMRIYRFSLK